MYANNVTSKRWMCTVTVNANSLQHPGMHQRQMQRRNAAFPATKYSHPAEYLETICREGEGVYVIRGGLLTDYKATLRFNNPHATSLKCNSRSQIRSAEKMLLQLAHVQAACTEYNKRKMCVCLCVAHEKTFNRSAHYARNAEMKITF